jgi:hypothetical protein
MFTFASLQGIKVWNYLSPCPCFLKLFLTYSVKVAKFQVYKNHQQTCLAWKAHKQLISIHMELDGHLMTSEYVHLEISIGWLTFGEDP